MTQLTPNQIAALKAAITPDHHSRAAYVGQVTQTEEVTIMADDGTSFTKEVTFTVSWDSILKILAIINKRAGI